MFGISLYKEFNGTCQLQGAISLHSRRLNTFYFCELRFFYCFPGSFYGVLHSVVLSVNLCILIKGFSFMERKGDDWLAVLMFSVIL